MISVQTFKNLSSASSGQYNGGKAYKIFARIFNLLVAVLVMLLLSPILLLIALLIIIESPGSAIFLQNRVGKNAKVFLILKFRTLYKHHFGLDFSQEHVEPYRITKVGRFLRRSKLDELPQLVNIIGGQMNFIGPRPDLEEQVRAYLPFQHERLNVKPGLTGLSQICGNTLLGWPERIKLDILYARKRNLALDLYVLFATIVLLVQGEAAATRKYYSTGLKDLAATP